MRCGSGGDADEPPFHSSYIDVGAAGGVVGKATVRHGTAGGRMAMSLDAEARHAALLAAVQGSVLAELLEAAREAFAFWHWIVGVLVPSPFFASSLAVPVPLR